MVRLQSNDSGIAASEGIRMNVNRLALLHRAYFPLMRPFRRKRIKQFMDLFEVGEDTRILDVGGSELIWSLLPERPRVTFLNLHRTITDGAGDEMDRWVIGDGCLLPFKDQAFDIVFTNSVIEHLGDAARQLLFANEVKRVGRRYYVQTPNHKFPIEPHYVTPFIHYLPQRWRVRLSRNFTIWGLVVRPSPDDCERQNSELKLLRYREVSSLFPDAQIIREKFLGLTKSFVIVKNF